MKKKIRIALATLVALLLIGYFGAAYYFMTVVTQPVIQTSEEIRTEVMRDVNIDVNAIDVEKTVLKVEDGTELETIVYRNPNPQNKVIVLSHGIRQNAYRMLMFFNMYKAQGFDIVSFSYRNHGESTKGFTTFGRYETKDLARVVEFAHKTFGKDKKYGIHGVSMGAAIMLQYAGMDQYKDTYDFLVSDCSFSSLNKELEYRFKVEYGYLSLLPVIPTSSTISSIMGRMDYSSIRPEDSVKNIKKPILFVHGVADSYIPVDEVDVLANNATAPHTVLKVDKADHADSYKTDSTLYEQTFNTFLNENKL